MNDGNERAGVLAGAIMLLGLAFLVYAHFVWPGILAVIWLASVPVLVAEEGLWRGLFGLVPAAGMMLLGLPFLIETGHVWPLILPLVWAASIPVVIVEEGWEGLWFSTLSGVWLGGVAFMFAIGFPLLPGLLMLAGFSALMVMIMPERYRGDNAKSKSKRRFKPAKKLKNDDTLPLAPRARRLSDLNTEAYDPYDPYDDSEEVLIWDERSHS